MTTKQKWILAGAVLVQLVTLVCLLVASLGPWEEFATLRFVCLMVGIWGAMATPFILKYGRDHP